MWTQTIFSIQLFSLSLSFKFHLYNGPLKASQECRDWERYLFHTSQFENYIIKKKEGESEAACLPKFVRFSPFSSLTHAHTSQDHKILSGFPELNFPLNNI